MANAKSEVRHAATRRGARIVAVLAFIAVFLQLVVGDGMVVNDATIIAVSAGAKHDFSPKNHVGLIFSAFLL
ncbi:MAG: hypothetical protein IJP66_06095 [Kiritimatiellae bacterium]|nr:hypothetical protein [Kiritimatiellia bacterium]